MVIKHVKGANGVETCVCGKVMQTWHSSRHKTESEESRTKMFESGYFFIFCKYLILTYFNCAKATCK